MDEPASGLIIPRNPPIAALGVVVVVVIELCHARVLEELGVKAPQLLGPHVPRLVPQLTRQAHLITITPSTTINTC
jgi:uncharacterized membrane protein